MSCRIIAFCLAAKTVQVGSIETFRLPPGFVLHVTQATLTDPNLKQTISLLVSTANYDGESTTVAMAHLSKRLPQTPLNLTFTDDRLHFAATAEGAVLPDVAVDICGFIDALGELGYDSGSGDESSSDEEGAAGALQWDGQDSSDDSSDDTAAEEEYLLRSAMADSDESSDSEGSGAPVPLFADAAAFQNGTSDGSSSDDSSDATSASDEGDSGAVQLAYVGDDAAGNAQLVTAAGELFTVSTGEGNEDSLYLVPGVLNHQLAASSDSASGSSGASSDSSQEQSALAVSRSALAMPPRGTKRRRHSSAAVRSSKKSAR
jgi:hypothetical protein